MPSELVIQNCGCIAIPEDVAEQLSMTPGTNLKFSVDATTRSITLTALGELNLSPTPVAACPIKP